MDESDLVKGIREGKLTAYQSLINQYYIILCNYATFVIHDRDSAEDIVSDVLLKLWEKHEEIVISSSLKSYLFRWVYNRCVNYLEHQKIKTLFYHSIESEISNYTEESPLSKETPYTILICKDLEHKIKEAINGLPDQCRKIFELSRIDGLSYQEIADHLQISINTVKTHMKIALAKLHEQLADYLPFLLIFLFPFK